jgi:hypothetical protein
VHTRSLAVALTLLSLACASTRPSPSSAAAAPPEPPHARTGLAPEKNPFLHAVGRDLFDGQGKKVVLQGICFGNDVWAARSIPPALHHREQDFKDLHALGVNAVRFYLSYHFFEDDAEPFQYLPEGFAWLDQSFAWARASGVYLILNIHLPPGGFQSNGGGGMLWTLPGNQDRFVALWKELARRYKDEPALAGYDILNEPVVAGDPEAWERLARRTTAALREIDPAHAIFVERLNAVMSRPGAQPDWNENRNGKMNFFLLDDTNVVYEFHFYKPMAFTHQGASWIPFLRDLTTVWPGPFKDWDGRMKPGDRDYLARELAPYFAFGREQNLPLYLGEFGVIRQGFEAGRNGTGWVSDVIDLARGAGVSFTYHTFHEEPFGLYGNAAGAIPGERNEKLWQLFGEKLGGKQP